MATRVGIELSPAACRIIEVDARPLWRRQPGETRVRSFAVLPPSGPETQAKLESLRKRHAAVVVWSGPSEHRQVVVTGGSYESMRTEAIGALAAAGIPTRGVWADIAPASTTAERGQRGPVVVALASAHEMTAALQPLRDAGIRLRTVTTPAAALGSLARLRQTFSVPDAIEAYVALEEQVTCIALVRSGVLVAARDLAWGYLDEDDTHAEQRPREDIATRLGDAITEFVAGTGGSPRDIGQVCVCGGLPELRSMTAPLMERLDVEVEPLDSMFGIDVASLPEPDDEFRERGAELRLAWAVTADWPPPINLLRARRRQVSKAVLGRVAVVTGVAAGLAVGWRVERSPWWRSTAPKPATRTASPVVATRPPLVTTPPAVATKPPVVTLPPVAATKPPVVTPPPVIATRSPDAPPRTAVSTKPADIARPPVVATKPPVGPLPPVPAATPAVAAPPRPATPAPPPVQATTTVAPPVAARAEPPRIPQSEPVERPAAPTAPSPRSEPAPARVRPAPAPEVALPFDAVLGTILYSPDRKLAIIDGRIVGPGDEVRGARVIDITSNSVTLRDRQGRLRRLTLSTGMR